MLTRIRDDLSGVKDVDERLVARIERDWLVFDVTKAPRKLSRLETAILAAPPQDLNAVAVILSTEYKLSRKSANRIAMSFGRKASDQIGIQRQVNLGITKAWWVYQGYRGCDHKTLDGKTYNIKKGMRFHGRRIYPGAEPKCLCYSRPIIRGSDYGPVRQGVLRRLMRLFTFHR